jgi:nucleoside-diphosphate-sugar epimerase
MSVTTGNDLETKTLSSSDWQPITIEETIVQQNTTVFYSVAKAEAEKAVWKFVQEQKPAYSVTVLLPALIFGPPIQPVSSPDKLNFSSGLFYGLFRPGAKDRELQGSVFPSHVSLRTSTAVPLSGSFLK